MLISKKKLKINICMSGGVQKKRLLPPSRSDINQSNCYFLIKHSFLGTFPMKYMLFINYIKILTLFDKFITFLTVSINLLLFDHDICYSLKYSAGNLARDKPQPASKLVCFGNMMLSILLGHMPVIQVFTTKIDIP